MTSIGEKLKEKIEGTKEKKAWKKCLQQKRGKHVRLEFRNGSGVLTLPEWPLCALHGKRAKVKMTKRAVRIGIRSTMIHNRLKSKNETGRGDWNSINLEPELI